MHTQEKMRNLDGFIFSEPFPADMELEIHFFTG